MPESLARAVATPEQRRSGRTPARSAGPHRPRSLDPARRERVGQLDVRHLREVRRPRPRHDPRPLVAAAPRRDPAPAGGVVRQRVQHPRGRSIGVGGQSQVGERIARVGVASQLGHEHVGRERVDQRPARPRGTPPAMRRRRCPAASGTLIADPGAAGPPVSSGPRPCPGRTRFGAYSWIEIVSTRGSS